MVKKHQSEGKHFPDSQPYTIQVYSFIESAPDAELELGRSRLNGGRLTIHLPGHISTILFNGFLDSSKGNFQIGFVHRSESR